MYFAQQHYPQALGFSTDTIAEAGCLLTADCNLLIKLNGNSPDPVTLNEFYKLHGQYISGTDNQKGWSTVSSYDPTIIVTQTGNGAVPPSNISIVKFHYNSVHTGQPIDHYTLVDHIEGNQVFIIDSWDGQLKGPAQYQHVYHLPIAWAVFAKHVPVTLPSVPVPAPAPPLPAPSKPPSAPAPFPVSDVRYEVVVPLQGYTNATSAGNHAGIAYPVEEGEYFVFRTYPGKDYLKNISKVKGQPGWWVNDHDNVVPEPEPVPVVPSDSVGPRESSPPEVPVVVEPVPEPVPEPTPEGVGEWEATYQPYKEKERYKTAHTYLVGDISGQETDLSLAEGTPVWVYGTFAHESVKYYRLRHPGDTDFKLWYGVPILSPATGLPVLLSDTKVKPRPALHNAPSTGTILKDTTHLLTARIEEDFMKFIDFKPGKWFNNKKNKRG